MSTVKTNKVNNINKLCGYFNLRHNYPTAFHRLRILSKFLDKHNDFQRALDITCGGAQLTLALAKRGMYVDGIDTNENILKIARQYIDFNENIKESVNFYNESLSTFAGDNYDLAVALNLTQHIPDDEEFFEIMSKKVNSGGYLVASFKNELFNLFHVTNNAHQYENFDHIAALQEEANEFLQDVEKKDTRCFLEALIKSAQKALIALADDVPMENKTPFHTEDLSIHQSTPRKVLECANKFGFSLEKIVGLHPHISLPSINTKMPEHIYNILSDSLIPLEEHPLALRWSALFVCILKKD